MNEQQQIIKAVNEEQWAIIQLMGHSQTAGRIEHGNLLRVDVPKKDGFATVFYGWQAIFSVSLVSEEIARAYAPKESDVFTYDAPIVTREQHESEVRRLRAELSQERQKSATLENRLTAVNALPEIDKESEPTSFYPEDAIPW